ncbi:hypothetical protein [Paenibacillus puerhi]|uniref:hypothetical protein n=1 Tax=Paenibacillus puerhi TaxID=2692622 RepID=UPI00135C269A|nr:hypothetical protein [Paenibacillus puerhi]
MFDPTIFDNLKVVMEGRLYDLDSEGSVRITGREDLVDLAAMSRTFRMLLRQGSGHCQAVISLSSGLTDFALERRIARSADLRPGAVLQLILELPAAYSERINALHDYLVRLWGEEAEVRHELAVSLLPEADAERGKPSSVPDAYRISIRFDHKIDESHIEDLEQWLDIAAMCLEHVEERKNWE